MSCRNTRRLALVWTGAMLACLAVAGPPDPLVHRDDLDAATRERVARVLAPATDFSRPESFEAMAAGAGTVDKLVNADIFSHPSANLDFAGRERFAVGNGLFRKDWVTSPSSTQASDGLGPLFNARSCQACHVKDGRGHVPERFEQMQREEAVGLLLRLSVPASDAERRRIDAREINTLPEPLYGGQLQNFAAPGLAAEGSIAVDYEEFPVELAGGETVMLRKPAYRIENLGYGPMREDVMISPRLAPPMLGLGLLEAIHEGDILANAQWRNDPDGVRGRANRVPVLHPDGTVTSGLGRFGWKAGQPTITQQSADAFANDMGLSNALHPDPWGDCTPGQAQCRRMPHGAQPALGPHEVSSEALELVDSYASNLAVPQRRDVHEPRVLDGKRLFYQARCTACHVPKYVTRRDAPRSEHAFQLIWPYTDLLLHDMGEGLADGRPEGEAGPRDWRTPPLWGIGHTRTVNPRATYLHDGRARTLLEAILWHGGEGQAARDRVAAMTPQERADLIRFLESL